MSAAPLFEVRLLGIPLLLRERSQQQGADLLREMALIRTGQSQGVSQAHVPTRLLELAHELDTFYGPYVQAGNLEMDAALDRGEDSVDIAYEVPADAAEFVGHIRDILAEVAVWCRGDDYLLTLAPAPDIAAYREWSIEQVLQQYAGEPATSWPDFLAARAG